MQIEIRILDVPFLSWTLGIGDSIIIMNPKIFLNFPNTKNLASLPNASSN